MFPPWASPRTEDSSEPQALGSALFPHSLTDLSSLFLYNLDPCPKTVSAMKPRCLFVPLQPTRERVLIPIHRGSPRVWASLTYPGKPCDLCDQWYGNMPMSCAPGFFKVLWVVKNAAKVETHPCKNGKHLFTFFSLKEYHRTGAAPHSALEVGGCRWMITDWPRYSERLQGMA